MDMKIEEIYGLKTEVASLNKCIKELKAKLEVAVEALEEVKGIHTDSGSVACRLKNIALKALSTLRGKGSA